MFIVFNKQKIYSYLIALSTVVTLFVIAFMATENVKINVIETSVNQVNTNEMANKIKNNM